MTEENINLTKEERDYIEYIFNKYQLEDEIAQDIKEKLILK